MQRCAVTAINLWRTLAIIRTAALGSGIVTMLTKRLARQRHSEVEAPHAKAHSSGIAAVLAKQNGNNAEAKQLMEMEQASESTNLLDRLISGRRALRFNWPY